MSRYSRKGQEEARNRRRVRAMMQQLVDLGFVERRTDEAGQEGYQVTAEGLAQYGEELASLGLPPNATAEQVLGAREQQESAAIAEYFALLRAHGIDPDQRTAEQVVRIAMQPMAPGACSPALAQVMFDDLLRARGIDPDDYEFDDLVRVAEQLQEQGFPVEIRR